MVRGVLACLVVGLSVLAPIGAFPANGVRGADQPAPPGKRGAPAARNVGGAIPAEFEKFAADFKAAAHAEDVKPLVGLFDWPRIFTAAIAGFDVPEASRLRLGKALDDHIAKTGGDVAARIIEQTSTGGRYDLVRVHMVDGTPHALFRLVGTEEVLDYHDVTLVRTPQGTVLAGEVFDLGASETLSAISRRSLLPPAAAENKDLAARLKGADKAIVTAQTPLLAFYSALQEKSAAGALTRYDKLPDELKKDRHVLLLRLRAAQTVDDKTGAAVLADVRRLLPADVAVDLNSIDWQMQRKDLVQARAALARIDKAVGGDPFLNTLRARMLIDEGKVPEARKLFEDTISAHPDIENAYWGLLEIVLPTKNFNETARLLKILVERFDADLSTLSDIPLYGDFVKSAQYEALVKSKVK